MAERQRRRQQHYHQQLLMVVLLLVFLLCGHVAGQPSSAFVPPPGGSSSSSSQPSSASGPPPGGSSTSSSSSSQPSSASGPPPGGSSTSSSSSQPSSAYGSSPGGSSSSLPPAGAGGAPTSSISSSSLSWDPPLDDEWWQDQFSSNYFGNYASSSTFGGEPVDLGCQHPRWKGDSFCDKENNASDCDYDGGDCCASTCSGKDCGFYTGFNCRDPDALDFGDQMPPAWDGTTDPKMNSDGLKFLLLSLALLFFMLSCRFLAKIRSGENAWAKVKATDYRRAMEDHKKMGYMSAAKVVCLCELAYWDPCQKCQAPVVSGHHYLDEDSEKRRFCTCVSDEIPNAVIEFPGSWQYCCNKEIHKIKDEEEGNGSKTEKKHCSTLGLFMFALLFFLITSIFCMVCAALGVLVKLTFPNCTVGKVGNVCEASTSEGARWGALIGGLIGCLIGSWAGIVYGSSAGEKFDTQSYIYRPTAEEVPGSENEALVIFRGTEAIEDIMTDAMAFLVKMRSRDDRSHAKYDLCGGEHGDVLVHFGFWAAFDAWISEHHKTLWDSVAGKSTVTVAGHSLGGALATLCAAYIAHEKPHHPGCENLTVRCITIGSPRVGSASFARVFNSSIQPPLVNSLRFFSVEDPVARLLYCSTNRATRSTTDPSMNGSENYGTCLKLKHVHGGVDLDCEGSRIIQRPCHLWYKCCWPIYTLVDAICCCRGAGVLIEQHLGHSYEWKARGGFKDVARDKLLLSEVTVPVSEHKEALRRIQGDSEAGKKFDEASAGIKSLHGLFFLITRVIGAVKGAACYVPNLMCRICRCRCCESSSKYKKMDKTKILPL